MTNQIIVDGLLVNYIEINPQAVSTAVFLHGWKSEAAVWNHVLDKMSAKQIRLIALDLPGFGKSQMPKKSFDVGDYANFVKLFLEKIGIAKATIIGHSFGGRVGIKLTDVHPEIISKLVLVDSAGFKNTSAVNVMRNALTKLSKPFFALPGLRSLKNPALKMMGSKDYVEAGGLKETFIKTINEDLTTNLPKIKAPTLLVWGGKDKDTPVEFGERMKALIPNSQLVIFPNAGHFSFLDEPEKFVTELEKFLL